jgi:arylsulfatase A
MLASAGQDSYSFFGALTGTPASGPVREMLVHHSGDGMFSLRQGRWKLIRGLGSGGFTEPRHVEPSPGGPLGQLYDMESDQQETGNAWLDHPEMVETLASALDRSQSLGYTRPGARP